MSRLAKACAALMTVGMVAPAMAADLPTKAPKAPPVMTSTWTSCYLGANAGGGSTRAHYIDPLAVPPVDLGRHTGSGPVGGGQIGCDYQVSNWVVGARGLFDWADVKGEHAPLGAGDVFSSRISSFALATARIGYIAQPDLLLYVQAGGAWIRDRERKIDLGVLEGAADVSRSGWTVGGGLEVKGASGWSFFVEYDYMDFSRRSVIFTNFEVPPVPPTFPLNIRQSAQVVLLGVNYRFGAPGALVANY
jgi:outer membrane immunogenic protein